jgi:pimeloyl-ACP methyl ester carboxylesterase
VAEQILDETVAARLEEYLISHCDPNSPELEGELVSVETRDRLQLYGMLCRKGTTVLAHTHGTASGHGIEAFEQALNKFAQSHDWGYLTFDNRGAHVLEDWQVSGAAVEKFTDSHLDLEAWIKYLKTMGAKNLILSGHSLGAEKIVDFVRRYADPMVKGLILLSPADTPGAQEVWEKKSRKSYLKKAEQMVSRGEGGNLLPDEKAHGGFLPMSAGTYLDFFAKDSCLRQVLPFKADELKVIPIPTIGIVPSKDEWCSTTPGDYFNKLQNIDVMTRFVKSDHNLATVKHIPRQQVKN